MVSGPGWEGSVCRVLGKRTKGFRLTLLFTVESGGVRAGLVLALVPLPVSHLTLVFSAIA